MQNILTRIKSGEVLVGDGSAYMQYSEVETYDGLEWVDYHDLYHQNYNGHYEVGQILFDAFLDSGILAPASAR